MNPSKKKRHIDLAVKKIDSLIRVFKKQKNEDAITDLTDIKAIIGEHLFLVEKMKKDSSLVKFGTLTTDELDSVGVFKHMTGMYFTKQQKVFTKEYFLNRFPAWKQLNQAKLNIIASILVNWTFINIKIDAKTKNVLEFELSNQLFEE